jgi:hypothetical protein
VITLLIKKEIFLLEGTFKKIAAGGIIVLWSQNF